MNKIVVGRFDNSKMIECQDVTLKEAFDQAGFTKADNEEYQDLDGNVYDGSETIEDSVSYFLVERVKSGAV